MFLKIILSQILAVFCQLSHQNKNIEIEFQYLIDGSFENLKLRNVRPIPQDSPENYNAPKVVPGFQSANHDVHDYKNNIGRFANRRMNMKENPLTDLPKKGRPNIADSKTERLNNSASNLLQVLEELNDFRQELVEEAQKHIRSTSEPAINIEQSELGLRPRPVEPLYKFRRMTGDNERLKSVKFRKTMEIRGIKKYDTNTKTNSGAKLLLIKYRKQNLEKTTTLSPRDRDRKSASEVYKFLKAVSLATPTKKKKDALMLQITRSVPLIIQEDKNINAKLQTLGKEIDLLAADPEQDHINKLPSLLSRKSNNFTSPRADENKIKTLIDIAKAIELITSQNAKDVLSQLNTINLESKINSLLNTNPPTEPFKLNISSEHLANSNLTNRERQLELELKKIGKEVQLSTPEKDNKLSTLEVFSVSLEPTISTFPFSHEHSNSTATEATDILKILSTPTKNEKNAQFGFHDIMKHTQTNIKLENRSDAELYGTHEKNFVKDKEAREISSTTRETVIFPNSFSLGRDVTLPEITKQTIEVTESQIDFAHDKQSNSVLEQLNKLLNQTLLQRLIETKQVLPNAKAMHQTTVKHVISLRKTKKRSNRPKNMRRAIKMQRQHKLRKRRKHLTRKHQTTKESEIDKFRRQLRMEYDSFE